MQCPTERAANCNPDVSYWDSRGVWTVYLLFFVIFHVMLVSLPILSVPMAWTLTNIVHNLVRMEFIEKIKFPLR